MKMFFEARKKVAEYDNLYEFPEEIFRVEITSEEEAFQIKERIKDLFDEFFIHYCYHDEGKACEIKHI